MTKYLRAIVDSKKTPKEGDGPILFVASTSGVKRDGKDLDQNRWDLVNYRSNPVILWAHDYWGERPPIGRGEVQVRGDGLHVNVTFDRQDPFAADIERKYRQGFLNAVSVGWDEYGTGDDLSYDLLDISAVPVPGDPDALMERQYRALKERYEQPPEPEDGWPELATEMVGLFLPGADETDEDREARYNALLPAYRRLGKTAPEFLPAQHLAALDRDEIRGLFLEGEAELHSYLFDEPEPTVGEVLLELQSLSDDLRALRTEVAERARQDLERQIQLDGAAKQAAYLKKLSDQLKEMT